LNQFDSESQFLTQYRLL